MRDQLKSNLQTSGVLMTQADIKELIYAMRKARPADDGSQKEEYATWYYTCEQVAICIMNRTEQYVSSSFDHADFLLRCQGVE